MAACLISFLTARASFEPATARPRRAGTSFVSQTVTGRAAPELAQRGPSTLRPNRNAYVDLNQAVILKPAQGRPA